MMHAKCGGIGLSVARAVFGIVNKILSDAVFRNLARRGNYFKSVGTQQPQKLRSKHI